MGVGMGAQLMGKVIMWDSGNSVGEISGHMKKINACSYKSTRPFRIVTGGEEGKVNFYEGPPFKYKATPKTQRTEPAMGRATITTSDPPARA